MTASRLADELLAASALPDAWRAEFLAVPRHLFLPARFWVDDEQGRPIPVSWDDDPDSWLEWAYRNVPILIQFDDGRTVWPDAHGDVCTSSASKPEHVFRMLDTTDVRDGHRVLEIGTGTGYNAALLAARVGSGRVSSVEIDSDLALSATRSLTAAGFEAQVLTGDGTNGSPAGAPYDRVIATASVRVGELPLSWVRQARPGGLIVTPMRTDFGGAVALVRFTVEADEAATGQPVGRVGFMAVRGHRTPEWKINGRDPDDPAAETSTTRLKPWRVVDSHDVRWAIGTQVPSCVWEHQPPIAGRAEHLLWLLDPVGDSWAVARYNREPGPREIRQYGPRRLWDEVEAAFRVWTAAGKPAVESTTLTVKPGAQSVRFTPFDEPADDVLGDDPNPGSQVA